MSEIKVNSIKGVGASTAAITVDNTTGTCTANLTNRTNKNLVINGACLVSQRGTSSTASGYGTVDRFKVQAINVDEAPTQSQATISSGTTPYELGFRKSLKITNGNQTSGAGAGDYITFAYRIEAQDMASSGWNYKSTSSFISLSFYIKSSVAQSFGGFLRTHDGSQMTFPFETGSLSADTWTKITRVIPGNGAIDFSDDTGTGLEIMIGAFWGTDYTASGKTLDAWSSYSNDSRLKDFPASTWYTTNDATLEITGLQVEVSNHVTSFEHLSFADELRRCQRYFFNITGDNNTKSSVLGYANSSSNFRAVVNFPTPMRANPTFSGSATSMVVDSSDDSSSFNVNTIAVNSNTTNSNPFQQCLEANPGGMTAGQGGQFEFRANSGFMNFSAEI